MIVLRYLLFPFAVLYGFITGVRNFLYDTGVLKSYTFEVPVIAVGNLSVGGTGKTPQVEYLIRLLLPHYKIATLSRGYKRKSKGFVLADSNSNAELLGDEPYQMHLKFPQIQVAVDANRKNGIERLLARIEKPEVILLDDAFQHRRVKAGFYILLTAYGDLFTDDFMLPTGMLRECRKGARRADVILVTKCPPNLSEDEQQKIKDTIGGNAPIYFTSIQYDDKIYNESEAISVAEIVLEDPLAVAGIAKPQPFFDYIKSTSQNQLVFSDHHHFTQADIKSIHQQANGRPIITTEKDYVRLKKAELKLLYFLPIKSHFISGVLDFNTQILQFVNAFKAQ